MATGVLSRRKKADPAIDPTASPMSADEFGAGVYEWPNPAKPSALMVPKYIREGRAADKTRRQVVLGVGVALVAASALVAGAFLLNQTSKSGLDQATAAQAGVQQQVDALASVSQYYDGLDTRRQATTAALADDIAHDRLLSDILAALPPGADLTSYKTTTGAPCVSPDPFSVPTGALLGCISISGDAQSENQVAQIVAALDNTATKGVLVDPFASGIEVSDGQATFTISVNFTDKALSLRYVSAEDAAAAQAAQAATTTTTTTDGAQ